MTSDIDWQQIQTATTMLALNEGSAELGRMRELRKPDTAMLAANKIADVSEDGSYAGPIDEQTTFEETKKVEAIKAYVARKSRNG